MTPDRGKRSASKEARRPLIITRYPGGKKYLYRWIEGLFPEAHRYVEGFAGNATVLLNRRRSEQEYLIERNLDQANMLRAIRDQPQDLIERLRPVQWAENTFKFAKWLLEEASYHDNVDRAALYYTIRKMSRGGEGQRHSSNFDRHQQGWWDNGVADLAAISERLRGVEILGGDAMDWLATLDGPGTLFYLDPPYVRSSRSPTPLYGLYEMTDDAHRSLCRLIRRLEGKVVLSGYANSIYEELLGDWRQDSRPMYVFAHCSISAKRRYKKVESLWMNF